MPLSKGWESVALKLQEQATGLANSDVCRWLSDACNDAGCWYVDHIGDNESGDLVYCCSGDMKQAPYEIRTVNGKVTASIDTDAAIDVLPRTTYEPEADEDDHYASMEAQRLYSKGSAKFIERFISKAERDAADGSSFAGKGKSYPILKPGDVSAAVHAMGRAGSDNVGTSTLKKNIIRIAKAKGWGKYLPKSWQGDDAPASEAAVIEITGEFVALKEGAVGQDGTAYLKLIAPGWGSSGYYSKEMLSRDGAKAFPKGTKNFWDHATDAEESQRPEGSLRNLASVLTEDAHYEHNGPAGAGLYAKARVFEDFRQPIDQMAKDIGMSIRADGTALKGEAEGRSGPIIEKLHRGISVDYVTTPGAGGQILQLFEAARSRNSQGEDTMTDEEKRQLREAQSEIRKLRERQALNDASPAISEYFTTVRVGEAIQSRVRGRVLAGVIPIIKESGDLDKVALVKMVEAETKEEVAYISQLTGGRFVEGMGTTAPAQLTEAQRAEIVESDKAEANEFAGLFGFSNKGKGRKIMREGRAAFDPTYNAGRKDNVTSGAVAVEV